jgi:anti-anti-sigma factor
MPLADVRVEIVDGVPNAWLSGEIDTSNAGAIRDQLNRTVPNEAMGLVFDLSEVDYLDSAGIHMIHRLRRDLQARGQRLALVVPRGSIIHDTLRLAGLRWEEELSDSSDAARRRLSCSGR